MSKLKFEEIDTNLVTTPMKRARIETGWIVITVLNNSSVSTAFVPDADHLWVVKN